MKQLLREPLVHFVLLSAMQNQNGVRVELVTTTQGLKFALGANGVNMKIKQ